MHRRRIRTAAPRPRRASRRLLPVALLAVLAAPALSADLDPPAIAGPAPAVDWTGAYGGLSFGAVRDDGRAERGRTEGDLIALDVSNGLFPGSIDGAETAALGGLTLGYNLRRGGLVGGVELDLSALDGEVELGFSRVDPNPDPLFNGVTTTTGYETETRSLATLRLRAGVARGRSLLYATAGLAAGEVRNAFTLAIPELGYASPGWSEDEVRFGYVLGLGAERRVGARVSVKIEALYYDLEDARIEGTDPGAFPGQRLDYEFANDGVVARVGVNIAF